MLRYLWTSFLVLAARIVAMFVPSLLELKICTVGQGFKTKALTLKICYKKRSTPVPLIASTGYSSFFSMNQLCCDKLTSTSWTSLNALMHEWSNAKKHFLIGLWKLFHGWVQVTAPQLTLLETQMAKIEMVSAYILMMGSSSGPDVFKVIILDCVWAPSWV